MTLKKKIEIYNMLLAGLSKGVKFAAILKKKGSAADYKNAIQRNDDLAKRAAKLRRDINKDWKIGADTVIKNIKKSNDRLQGQIRKIEKSVAKGQTVVKALSYVDGLIDTAKTVAKAMS
jgi:hypothetical protein